MTLATLPVSGWTAPARAALDTYRRTSDDMVNLALPFESFARDEPSREFARLANRSARARAGVLREWTLSPLWWSGLASPADLYAEMQNAAAIDRDLSGAWSELVRSQVRTAKEEAHEIVAATVSPVAATELNALAVEAVRTATIATRATGQPEAMNAAAVDAVRVAALGSAVAEEARETAHEALDEVADIVLAGAEAATNAIPTPIDADDTILNSGVLERTGDSMDFVPATSTSAADEASVAASASRRTAKRANGKPA